MNPIWNSTRLLMLGIIYSWLSNLGISISHVILLRTGLYELEPRKKNLIPAAFSNELIQLVISGMMLAQFMVILSIYLPPVYAFWLKPHVWNLLSTPYIFFYACKMLTASMPMTADDPRYRYEDLHIRSHLFIDSFLAQIHNPIVLPTPLFIRVLSSALFRYSQAGMFMSGVAVGWLGGSIMLILMTCTLIYVLGNYTPSLGKKFDLFYFRFFRYFAVVFGLIAINASSVIITRDNLPLVEADTMRLKDFWPNSLFDSTTWHRPLWFPVAKQGFEDEQKIIATVEADKKPFIPKEMLMNYKRVSQYFFREAVHAGKARLLHNYPPSLAIAHENLEIVLDYPFLSQASLDQIQNEWLNGKAKRRDEIYLKVVKRLSRIKRLRRTFEKVVQKKIILNVETLKRNQNKIRIEHANINVDPVLSTTLIGKSPPTSPESVVSPEQVKFHHFHEDETNKLKEWISEEAQDLEENVLLPWEPLSSESCLALPLVLNNQLDNYDPTFLHNNNFSWDRFIASYEAPLLPKYPEKGNFWLANGAVWVYNVELISYLGKWIKTSLEKQLGLIDNLSTGEKRVRSFAALQQNLPLYTMSNYNEESDPIDLMINRQDEPDIGEQLLAISPNFNDEIALRHNLPRKRKGQLLKWRQLGFLPPSVIHCKALQEDNQEESLALSLTRESDLNIVTKLKYLQVYDELKVKGPRNWDKIVKGIIAADRRIVRVMNRQQEVTEGLRVLDAHLHNFRGPLLIFQLMFRNYIKIPFLIYGKHLIRMFFQQSSELERDLEEFSQEEYRLCTYKGEEVLPPTVEMAEEEAEKSDEELKLDSNSENKMLETGSPESSENNLNKLEDGLPKENIDPIQEEIDSIKETIEKKRKEKMSWLFPEDWWIEGLQIKILFPFEFKFSHEDFELEQAYYAEVTKLVENDPDLAPLINIRQLIGQTNLKKPESCYLDISGSEVEAPAGGSRIFRSVFLLNLKLIGGRFLLLLRIRIAKIVAPIMRFPLWKILARFSSSVYSFIKKSLLVAWKAIATAIRGLKTIGQLIKAAVIKVKTVQKQVLPSPIIILSGPKIEKPSVTLLTKKAKKTKQIRQRKSVAFPKFNQFIESKLANTLLTRYALFEPLPDSILKDLPPENRFSFSLHYKFAQIKFLVGQIRKSFIFAKQYVKVLLTVEWPIWIKVQVQLLPNSLRLLRRISFEFLMDCRERLLEFLEMFIGKIFSKVLLWVYGPAILIESDIEIEKMNEPEKIVLTDDYILAKLWESKLAINPQLTRIAEEWQDDQVLLPQIEQLLIEEAITQDPAHETELEVSLNKEHLLKWLRHIAHLSPPKLVWSSLNIANRKKRNIIRTKIKSIQLAGSNHYPDSTAVGSTLPKVHDLLIKSAGNWSKLSQWYKLLQAYISEYDGLRIQTKRLRGRPRIDPGPYIKPYHPQMKDFSLNPNLEYLERDKESEKYFCFDSSLDILNRKPVRETDPMVDALVFPLNRIFNWYVPLEGDLSNVHHKLNRGFFKIVNDDTKFEEYEITELDLERCSLMSEFLFGQPDLSRLEEEDLLDNFYERRGHGPVVNWRIQLMQESVFTFNFVTPLFEFLTLAKSSDFKDRIGWLLDSSDKLMFSGLYESIMLPDLQREFRVLNLLNLDQGLPQYPAKILASYSVGAKTPEEVFSRFLWPTHRLEDLACMNRFWFGTANQSKCGLFRIRMYPLVKP